MAYRFRYYSSFLLERTLFYKQRLGTCVYRPLIPHEKCKEMKKLNLACSDRMIPGWVNVDVRSLPGVDRVLDVRDLSAFEDECFDIVRASHVLEHFYANELNGVLKEWTRVLKPAGWMIICVPDFDKTLLRYRFNPDSMNPCLFSEFGTAVPAQIYGDGFTAGDKPFYEHRMVYNRKTLTAVMRNFGKLQNFRVLNYLQEEPFTLGIQDDSTNVYSLNIAGQKPDRE